MPHRDIKQQKTLEAHAAQRTELAEFLLEHFMRTGSDLPVMQIAERIGWSASKVERTLGRQAGGTLPDGVTSFTTMRASTRERFGGSAGGHDRVRVYGPTREALAGRLRAHASENQMHDATDADLEATS